GSPSVALMPHTPAGTVRAKPAMSVPEPPLKTWPWQGSVVTSWSLPPPPSRSVVTPLGAAFATVAVSSPSPPNHEIAPPVGVADNAQVTVPALGVVHASVVASSSASPPALAVTVKLDPVLEKPNVSPAAPPTTSSAGSGVGVVANGE